MDDDGRCWLYQYGCPCRTGGCFGLPDEGCPVYRWFRYLIEEDINECNRDIIQS